MIEALESRIEAIEARNRSVSVDKAWEISLTRRIAICVVTYVTTLVTFWIPDANWYIAACIPVIGFLLSNMSFPWLRKRWEKYYFWSKMK